MNEITARQKMVLEFIQHSLSTYGYPPTLREIGQYMGIRSTNGVNDHLQGLQRKGYLERSGMKSRSIRLLQRGRALAPCTEGCCETSNQLRLRVAELEEKLVSIRRAL